MIAIIGAGISGLSLAYFLQKNKIPYILLEKSERVGGYLLTKKIGNYQIDLGANTMLVDNEMIDFLKELGLENEYQEAKEVSKNRYILKNGKYKVLPSKPQDLLFNTFFSWQTKWKIYRELKQKPIHIENENLTSFFTRRFSKEIVEYALTPFVRGIYAGNPDDLLIEKTFPILKKYENEYGSVIKGFMKNKSIERKKTIGFFEGTAILPQKIAEKLTNLHLNFEVKKIQKIENQYIINEKIKVDKIVLALPSFQIYDMIKEILPDSKILNEIEYPPMAVVYSAYKKTAVKHHLNGFGGLNPAVENAFALGSIWNSSVFDGRCPEDEVLLTTFIGGSSEPQKTLLPDEEIKTKVHQELAKQYQITDKPTFSYIARWEKALPQYNKKCLEAHHWIEKQTENQIFVCANWYGGVSLPDCIRKAKQLCQKLKES
jgi:oxygen-dependent protoporphyrinogen oxidase